MTTPRRNSRLIVVAFATRQPIECLAEQVGMLVGHFRDMVGATRIATGPHALIVLVAHQDKARLVVAGEDDELAAASST